MEKYNTLGKRFAALIIDSILLGVAGLIFSFGAASLSDNPTAFFIVSGLFNAINVFYFILLHAYYGQTLGKKAFGVKVVDDTEAPINFGQAVVRHLPELIPALFAVTLINPEMYQDAATQIVSGIISGAAVVFHIAGVVVCLVNEKHRALHDFIAGTVVVRTDV